MLGSQQGKASRDSENRSSTNSAPEGFQGNATVGGRCRLTSVSIHMLESTGFLPGMPQDKTRTLSCGWRQWSLGEDSAGECPGRLQLPWR